MVVKSMSLRQWPPARRKLAVVVLSAALAFLGVLAYFLVSSLTAASGPAPYGPGFATMSRPAPAVMLPSLSGRGSVSLPELAGKPIVINFWSTTCDICVAETRALAQVADDTKGRVSFLGIDNFDSVSVARAFAARYRIPYQVGYDPTETVGARYGVPGLPVTFFLSRSGKRIVGINVGALTARSLTDILHRLYGVV